MKEEAICSILLVQSRTVHLFWRKLLHRLKLEQICPNFEFQTHVENALNECLLIIL